MPAWPRPWSTASCTTATSSTSRDPRGGSRGAHPTTRALRRRRLAMRDAPSRSPELAEGRPNDRLPDLRPRFPSDRSPTLLLGCLPASGLARPPAVSSGRPHPVPLATPGHRLRVPGLRDSLPRRATLPRLPPVLPTHRPRRCLPALRRTRRPRRPLLQQRRDEQPITRHLDRHTHTHGADLSGLLLSRRLAHLLFGAHTRQRAPDRGVATVLLPLVVGLELRTWPGRQ